MKLGPAVHDDRPVPCHRLTKRSTRNQQKTNPHFAGRNLDLVAGAENHQRAVSRLVADFQFLSGELLFDIHPEWRGGVSKTGAALENIGKTLAPRVEGKPFGRVRRQRDIEIGRIGVDAVDSPYIRDSRLQ